VNAIEPARSFPMAFKVGPISHLIAGVEYGTITIHFEAGRPTYVERKESIRLNEGTGTRAKN
jgi:hypothetical protein